MACIEQGNPNVLPLHAVHGDAQEKPPDRLEKIRRNVVRAEARIARIISLIEEMRAHGQETQQAERLLRTHRDFLALSREFLAREETERAQRAAVSQDGH
jgi:hypothetical protein